jgi:MFS transporter, DHA3 family, macrolide efflux protein
MDKVDPSSTKRADTNAYSKPPGNASQDSSPANTGDSPPPDETPASRPADRDGLWNRNFLLLWQGQLVSSLGDVVYSIALGFWILAATGSTALMGSLMAASTVPRILVAPFAGVIVDRGDRRWLLVSMDVVRGVAVVLVAMAALTHQLHVWMVFAAGIIIGTGGAFFTPAVGSTLPDIVPRSRLMQGNSAFSLISTGSGILGNSVGGFLYQVLGAPFMFLANGISYLVSSASIVFIRIPKIITKREKQHFFTDMRDGFVLIWRIRGLRFLFLSAAVLNFFAVLGITLFLPLFQRSPTLGPGRYGVAMACLALGLFAGFLLGSVVQTPPERRFTLFMVCGFAMSVLIAAVPLVGSFSAMLALLAVAGVLNAVLNNMIGTTAQLTVPQDMRGKAFSLMGAVSQGLTPIAMALAGILAEFLPLPLLISGSFFATFLFFVPMLFNGDFKRFVSFDPERAALESLY